MCLGKWGLWWHGPCILTPEQKEFVVVGKTFRVVGWNNSWGWSCCDSPPSVQRILVSPYLSNRGWIGLCNIPVVFEKSAFFILPLRCPFGWWCVVMRRKKEGKSSLGIQDGVVSLVPEAGRGAWEGLARDSLWPHVSQLWPFSCQSRSRRNISFYCVAMKRGSIFCLK